MGEKTCFKCGLILPLSDFYKHSQMADGHLNKCKGCTKSDVSVNRQGKLEKYSEYESLRSRDPVRKEKALQYQRNRRLRNPDKNKARAKVCRALRDGYIVRNPCEFCGNCKVEAHHKDYSKPLEVVWVCFKCHREKFHGQVVVSER